MVKTMVRINSETDYKKALKRASKYSNNPPYNGSREERQYKELLASIETYEQKRFGLNVPTSIFDTTSMIPSVVTLNQKDL